ncbi:UNVERIFIED_ORG: hypothetical protein QE446_000300 [Rhizobium sp. SORGH_AS260]|nr:hypothetical protein [Rhizobium sp. SORGH_AS_0260]MDR6079403.1 hypothetical protein [Agrobacterium sp. SORGH_AS_0440]
MRMQGPRQDILISVQRQNNPAPSGEAGFSFAGPAQVSVVSTRSEAPVSAKRLKMPLVVLRSRSTSSGP